MGINGTQGREGKLNGSIQWGIKVYSGLPIVQVIPTKRMREACHFHESYSSTMRDKMRKIPRFDSSRFYLEIMVENKYFFNKSLSGYPLLAMVEVKRFL